MVLILLVVLLAGFLASFILSFAMGANDVANSFGTSVGSKVLTLKQAVIVASIFETAGSVLVGYQVTDTVRKGIVDISIYDTQERAIQLAFGALATLISSLLWLLIATTRKLPVSASHAIVGATLGFTLVMHGSAGVKWKVLGFIALSWIISPVLAGIVSAGLFYTVQRFILRKPDPITPGLRALPMIYAAAIFINALAISLNGSKMIGLENVPAWLAFAGSSAIALVVMIVVGAFVVPWQRRKIEQKERDEEDAAVKNGEVKQPLVVLDVVPEVLHPDEREAARTAYLAVENGNGRIEEETEDDLSNGVVSAATPAAPALNDNSAHLPEEDEQRGNIYLVRVPQTTTTATTTICPDDSLSPSAQIKRSAGPDDKNLFEAQPDPPKTKLLFSFVQILTACCASFAHGGNDVSNSVGPLVTIWLIYETGGLHAGLETPLWILFLGGVGISLGLLLLGRRVIETIGTDLTSNMTPSSGFCIELGTVATVLLASKIGVPISTTHCIIGSVVAVGYLRSRHHVDFNLLKSICFAWIVTLPATVAFSAAIMFAFKVTLPYF